MPVKLPFTNRMHSPFNSASWPPKSPRVESEPSLQDILSPRSGKEFAEGVGREWRDFKEGAGKFGGEVADLGRDIGQGASAAAGKVAGKVGGAISRLAGNLTGTPKGDAAQPKDTGLTDEAPPPPPPPPEQQQAEQVKAKLGPEAISSIEAALKSIPDDAPNAVGRRRNLKAVLEHLQPEGESLHDARRHIEAGGNVVAVSPSGQRTMIRDIRPDGSIVAQSGNLIAVDPLTKFELAPTEGKVDRNASLGIDEAQHDLAGGKPVVAVDNKGRRHVINTINEHGEGTTADGLLVNLTGRGRSKYTLMAGATEAPKGAKPGKTTEPNPLQAPPKYDEKDLRDAAKFLNVSAQGNPEAVQARIEAHQSGPALLSAIAARNNPEAADTDTEPKTQVEKPAEGKPSKPVFIDVRKAVDASPDDSMAAIDKIKAEIKAHQEAGGATVVHFDGKEIPVHMDARGIIRDPHENTVGLLALTQGMPGEKSGIELKPAEKPAPQLRTVQAEEEPQAGPSGKAAELTHKVLGLPRPAWDDGLPVSFDDNEDPNVTGAKDASRSAAWYENHGVEPEEVKTELVAPHLKAIGHLEELKKGLEESRDAHEHTAQDDANEGREGEPDENGNHPIGDEHTETHEHYSDLIAHYNDAIEAHKAAITHYTDGELSEKSQLMGKPKGEAQLRTVESTEPQWRLKSGQRDGYDQAFKLIDQAHARGGLTDQEVTDGKEKLRAWITSGGDLAKIVGDVLPQKESATILERIPDKDASLPRPKDRELPNTPEFNKWFGDSKVKTVVYHGTGSDFTEFSKQKVGQHGTMAGPGFYFAEDPDIANKWAKYNTRSQQGHGVDAVMPAYLKIDNPLDFDAPVGAEELPKWTAALTNMVPRVDAKRYEEGVAEIARQFGGKINGYALWKEASMWGGTEVASEVAAKLGYDGIKHHAKDELGTIAPPGKAAPYGNIYVAFEPTQIKSATGNNGQYDPKNPDIQHIFGFGRTQPPPNPKQPRAEEKFTPQEYAGRPFNPNENVPDPSGMSPHHKKVVGVLNSGLAGLHPDDAAKFKNDNHAIAARMTPEAAQHVSKGLRAARHVQTPEEVTAKFSTEYPGQRIEEGKVLGGFYDPADRRMTLDGPAIANDHTGLHAQQIKGHELGHAIAEGIRLKEAPNRIDMGGGHVPSGWQEAHDAEFKTDKMTKYAMESPQESFAESCAALLSGQLSPADFRREFPKSAAVMEKHGVLAKEAGSLRPESGPMRSPLAEALKDSPIAQNSPIVSPFNEVQARTAEPEGAGTPGNRPRPPVSEDDSLQASELNRDIAPEDRNDTLEDDIRKDAAKSRQNKPFDYAKADIPAYADKLTKDIGRGKAVEFVREHLGRLKYGVEHEHDPAAAKEANGFYEKTLHRLLGLHEDAATGSDFHPISPRKINVMGEEHYDENSPVHRMLKNTPDEHLAALASATHGSELTKIYRPSGWGTLHTSGNGAHSYRTFEPGETPFWQRVMGGAPSSEVKMMNGSFGIDDDSPLKGHGYQVFANQVAAARAAGIKNMSTLAAGPGFGKGYNGHYTWPRVGYEGEMHNNQFRTLPEDIRAKMGGSRSLRKLFDDVPGGKEAWEKSNIGTVPMHFATHPSSVNSIALEKYAKERDQKAREERGD